jgi:hypothetical protein
MSTVNFVIVKEEPPEISQTRFVALVARLFPAVADDLLKEDDDGLPYMQVACLNRYANQCLANHDLIEFERILRFVDYVIPKVDYSLDTALHVSFIEMLALDGDTPTKQAARQLLSPWQLEFYLEIVKLYAEIDRRNQAKAAQQSAPSS